MVVLAASILEKGRNGKVLFSRQFVPISKSRIEIILSTFPKLVGDDTQHTFVESESVRYLYQSIDDVYLVLVTNKQSDVIDDLQTLRLLARITIEELHDCVDVANICQHTFDLIFSFDEVITLGYKETISPQQIQTYLLMDSHEEKMEQVRMKNKEEDARAVARSRAEDIDRKKAEMRQMQGQGHGNGNNVGGGHGSGAYGGNEGYGNEEYSNKNANYGYSSQTVSPRSNSPPAPTSTAVVSDMPVATQVSTTEVTSKKQLKGLTLGKKKLPGTDFLSQAVQQEDLQAANTAAAALAHSGAAPAASIPDPTPTSLEGRPPVIHVNETVSFVLDNSNACGSFSIMGTMKVAVFDPSRTRLLVQTTGVNGINGVGAWRSQVRANINKQGWAQNVIAFNDPTTAYALGQDNASLVLQYKVSDPALAPFTASFWISNERGKSNAVLELTCSETVPVDLDNVTLHIPCIANPEVHALDGQWKYNAGQKQLLWNIPKIGPSGLNTATLEFSTPEVDDSAFYPVNITFSGGH